MPQLDPVGSVVTRYITQRPPHLDNFHKLFTLEGQLALNSNMIFIYGNNHNMIIEPFKDHSKQHHNSDNTTSKQRITPIKSNLFIHFGNANHEYFKPMLNTHRTIHLRTLTDLCDKWVYIRRGIGAKVNTVGKVGELNWCSSSRGNLVKSYLRRYDRGNFMAVSGRFCFSI